MLDITTATISQIQSALKNKELTVRELVLKYMERIAEVDSCENGLNSVLEINPDALMIADSLDAKLNNGEELGRLFGIPVMIKDNINTADKMCTSAGSLSLANHFAGYDAHIIKLLRQNDAIIFCKTNMTEFANYMAENMANGYSSRGGQVISPFNPTGDTSGSSSGSAVAVAAGLCPVAVGTETSGSIISPSTNNGIVGIKPTQGLVSRNGIIPISNTLDIAGPMAHNVEDAACLLTVLAGKDCNDAATCQLNSNKNIDYTSCLDINSLKNARIGITMDYYDKLDDDQKAAFENLKTILIEAGATLVDSISIERTTKIVPIMKYEFKRSMNAYLSTIPAAYKIRLLSDIVAFNQTHPEKALKYGQHYLIQCENETTGRLIEPQYIEAMWEREHTIVSLDELFVNNNLDVILCAAPGNIGAFTGFPVLTIPTGKKKNNMPTGSYWLARRFNEQKLISIAYAAEKLLNLNIKP